jgi:hypothetical protein
MPSRSLAAVVLAFLVVVSGSVVAVSTESAAADRPNRIDSCTTITEPGTYELNQSVDDAPDTDRRACIVVRSGDVTLDGNGHTINGTWNSVFVGTAIPFTPTAEPLGNVTIRDVVARNDVTLYRTPGATVRNVSAHDVELYEGEGSVVADNALTDPPGSRTAAISVYRSNDTVVANNTVTNTDEPNEHFLDRGSLTVGVSDNVTVRDNVVRSTATAVVVYDVTNGTFENNTAVGRDGRGLAVKETSRDNVFDGTDVSGSAVGVFVSAAAGNAFRNTTATDTSEAVLDARDGGRNRLAGLRVDSNTTVSVTGRNVVVRGVDAPPTVPSDHVAVGGFVEVVQYRGAELSLGVGYDEAAVEAAGLNESDLRLYRRPAEDAPSHVYAPMGSTTDAEDAGEWASVPGPSRVNETANVVSADVRPFDFDSPDSSVEPVPVDAGETVSGTITSDESDWYAIEVAAGEAILPTLNLVGPLENRAIRFSIIGPGVDGPSIGAYPVDAIHGDDYEAGAEWPAQGRQAAGAATAEENGTYYVRVSAGWTNERQTPGAYNLTVETRELDPFDPNQRREAATPLDSGETVSGSAAAYDPDWFAFEADAGERIRVSADYVWYPIAVSLNGPDGEFLGYVPEPRGSDTPGTLNVTAPRTGTYYVEVGQHGGNADLLGVGNYTLSVQTPADGGPGDGDGDGADTDTDGDGLTDEEEMAYGTDPTETDTDGDGWSDLSEVNRGCDPLDSASHPDGDTDGDGLTDREEENEYGTDPTDTDSDGDGWSDLSEVNRGCDPLDSASHP